MWQTDIHGQVQTLLRQLRGRIRRYVLIEGTATVLVWLGIAAWLSLGLDYLLELPRLLRALVATAAVILVVCGIGWWVVMRLVRQYRLHALALVLERRFPRLNDRLITLVERFNANTEDSPVTESMLHQTARELRDLLPSLEIREVFNRRPLWRSLVLSALLLGAMGAFAWTCDEIFRTWLRRNVLLADEYYRRETDLAVSILAQPGDRQIPFQPDPFHRGEFLPYKHPRGADLTLLAEVPSGKVVPEQVRLTYDIPNRSGGGRDYLTRLGIQQFRSTLPGIYDDLRLWLKGGDFASRSPYPVQVVDPPRLEGIVLDCLYPEYTRMNRRDDDSHQLHRESVPVQGTQISLPAGTHFNLRATSNKPLKAVRVVCEQFELRITPSTATFRSRAVAEGPAPREVVLAGPNSGAGPLYNPPTRQFFVPFALDLKEQPEVLDAAGKPFLPLRLAPNSTLLITLHDEDDIISSDPARLVVNSIPDEPPIIETALRGIGTSITHQANIPLVGAITDDYGIASANFEFRIDQKEALDVRNFRGQPNYSRKFPVAERFEVLPLDLKIGTRLTLSVVAADGDTLTGPHRSQGEKHTFTIVSNDELLALIATREINLRQRFEQILGELKTARKDVQLHRTRYEELLKLRTSPLEQQSPEDRQKQLAALEDLVVTAIARALSLTTKNANETASVEQAFRDIRDELENNAVPDVRRMLDRLDNGIVQPLHSVNTIDYNESEGTLKLLQQALGGKPPVPLAKFEAAGDRLTQTIEHMEAILVQMLKLESFNEVVQMLRDIIHHQEELEQRVKEQRKKKLIEGLQ